MKKMTLIGFTILFVITSRVFGAPDWCAVKIFPEHPSSNDVVAITLSGEWSNGCIPNGSAVSVVGNDIYFTVIHDYPPDIFCTMAFTGWTRTESVGPLLGGTYRVYAGLTEDPLLPPLTYTFMTEFAVTPSDKLEYAPVTPCRIVDTRKAGGALTPGDIRNYNVRGIVVSQGGDPAGCPSPDGEPHGVHVNVTAVPMEGSGNLRIFSFRTTPPIASLVNYKTGVQNIANSTAVKTCFNCDKDISIQSNFGTAHTVIDVLGYYYQAP